jgi:hypothetical protein
MSVKFCANCHFWRRTRGEGPGVPGIPGDPALGDCRRYAPHPTVGRGNPQVVWPATTGTDFCGEWSGDNS